ncbi:MAG: 30S ribosomal protein S17 [Spirochaetia bacterium]
MTKGRKIYTGNVVSDKMDKTIVVSITTKTLDPLYKKYLKRSKKVKAHDEENNAHVGDKVRVVESRPVSKEKCWRLLEIIERAK